ncbi:MAG: DUF4399 domain-containing protein, partial [Litorilinea sp.]
VAEDADTEATDTEATDTEAVDAEATDTDTAPAAHLFILVNIDPLEAGAPVPVDESFVVPVDVDGRAELSLSAGTYILRLQLADADLLALETDAAPIVVAARDGAAAQAVRIAMPTDGATVPPEFDVVMAATGLIVEPSGSPVEDREPGQAGHFHLLLNEDFVPEGEVIPADATHVHFGAAQLTTTLTLEPGVHVLRLQMADGAHIALAGAHYRDTITVTVDADTPARQVMFVEPEDGATVPPTFPVRWAAAGLLVEPIGGMLEVGRGHFHVLIDADFVEAGTVIPTDDAHRHFGGAQLATELTLEPGEYTLRLQMANGAHIALDGEEYQDTITIQVNDAEEPVDASLEDANTEDASTDDAGVAEPTDADADDAEDE